MHGLRFDIGLEFLNQRERIDAGEIQVQDDQRRVFPGFIQNIFLAFQELNRDASLLGSLVDLYGEHQVVENRDDSLG